jgi:predicted DNA-binding transcriptional regulator YafY
MLIHLRQALRARRKVRMLYRKGAAEEASERVVRSYGLMPANDTWYLVAHCETSGGIRFFRLDRVESVVILDEGYRIPQSASVKRLIASGKPFSTRNAETLTIRYSAMIARWIAEREKIPLAEDGSLTLELPLADVDWAVRHVLQYGPEAEVISPFEVREIVRRRLASMLTSASTEVLSTSRHR